MRKMLATYWLLMIFFSSILVIPECSSFQIDEDETEEEIDEESDFSVVVVEGDILVTKDPEGTQSASVYYDSTWPNATIPYTISRNYSDKQVALIKNGMKAFETETCIRFTEHKGEKDYIRILKPRQGKSVCHSFIGRQRGKQQVYIDDECVSLRSVKHELMHAIGFAHEQSRVDRDDYVIIHDDNIVDGKNNNNFRKYGDRKYRLLNTTYDLKSIMHYEWNAFAIDITKPTITAKDGSKIEKSEDFSRTDILEINRLYKCNQGQLKWGPSDNGQVQLAKNCSFFGQDIHQEKCSIEECSGLCLANSLCTHFTWVSDDNTCYITTDSSFNNVYPRKGSICGHITQLKSKLSFRDWENGQIKWAPRCDFFGLDFHHLKSGYKECGQICLNNTKCTHFTWEWQGNCYLKKLPKNADIYPYEKSICGYVNRRESTIPWKDGENGQIKWSKDCDFFGYDFRQEKSRDIECSGLCLANRKCTHFTWDWEGNCHLKSAPNSTSVYPFKGAVCGYVTQRQTTTFVWQEKENGTLKLGKDCDFFGYDIHEQKSTEEECSRLCHSNSECTHFTRDREGNCHLKKAPQSAVLYPYKGAVCGYKTKSDLVIGEK